MLGKGEEMEAVWQRKKVMTLFFLELDSEYTKADVHCQIRIFCWQLARLICFMGSLEI